jgi:hypothetical protein
MGETTAIQTEITAAAAVGRDAEGEGVPPWVGIGEGKGLRGATAAWRNPSPWPIHRPPRPGMPVLGLPWGAPAVGAYGRKDQEPY